MAMETSFVKGKTVRRLLGGSAFGLHVAIRLVLTVVVWVFLADFLLQFAHSRMDGKSLPERVHGVTALVQIPMEEAAGMDMRYDYNGAPVDLMPLVILTVAFFTRRRARIVYQQLRTAINGPAPEVAAVQRFMARPQPIEGSQPETKTGLNAVAPVGTAVRLVH